jgi:hypothetical protein
VKKIFVSVCLIQVLIIGILIYKVIKNRSEVLGASIAPIEKENIIFDNKNLEYFFEPKPGLVRRQLPWSSEVAENIINEDTLNSTKEYSLIKSKKTFRIIALGDSFTYGLYVPTNKNWPSQLEMLLNSELKCDNFEKFEVINLGVEGYDTEFSVERFIKRGIKYDPDLVLWLHIDLMRISNLLVPLREEELGKVDFEEIRRENLQKVKQSWRNAMEKIYKTLGADKILEYQANAISKFLSSYKGIVGFVVLPETLGNPSFGLADAKIFLKKTLSNRNNGFLIEDIRNFYTLDGSIRQDPHPNEKGHRIIAEDILKYLREQEVINCDHPISLM